MTTDALTKWERQADPEQLALSQQGRCARKKRNGTPPDNLYCLQYAGARTDHEGDGACWLHGGASLVKTGRYSDVKHNRLAQLVAELEEDPRLLDTAPEVAMVRGLLIDYIERYDVMTAALLAWHESYQPGAPHHRMFAALEVFLADYASENGEQALRADINYQVLLKFVIAWKNANPKPIQILDIASATTMASEVTKMVERVQKFKAATAISRKDFARIMQEIGNIIDATVNDDATKTKIRDRIATLKLA